MRLFYILLNYEYYLLKNNKNILTNNVYVHIIRSDAGFIIEELKEK